VDIYEDLGLRRAHGEEIFHGSDKDCGSAARECGEDAGEATAA
jgi:hypothetical protein